MSAQTIKVNMFILMANDIVAMIDFYEKIGLKLLFHVPGKWAEFDINGIKLGIAHTVHELSDRRTGIVLEVPDLYTFYTQAVAAGIAFLDEPAQASHGIVVSFRDPGLNILDFYQPLPEKVQDIIKNMKLKKCCGSYETCKCSNDTSQKKCCGGH